MTAPVTEFADIENGNANGVNLSLDDTIYVAGGVQIAGGIDGSSHNGLSSSDDGITAQILGNVWGHQFGIHFAGQANANSITIGTGASVIGFTNDGIRLDSGDSTVINHGDIIGASTAHGLKIAGADVNGNLIDNSGSISGGIGVSIAAASDNNITNTGTIDGLTYAIEIGAPTSQFVDKLTNSGIIEHIGDEFGAAIMDNGTNTLVIHNSGAINSQFDSISDPNGNIDLSNTGSFNGEISVAGSGGESYIQNSATGSLADISLAGAINEILNSGSIEDIFFDGARSFVINSGSISSLYIEGAGNTIVNDGTITFGIGFHNDIADTGDVNTLNNSGIISTSHQFAISSDTGASSLQITNSGHISGGIEFGTGDNVYDGSNGVVVGIVQAGAGTDVFTGGAGNEEFDVSLGTTTVNAGAGDDIIDFGANLKGQKVDGGTGTDTATLLGDYHSGVTFAADTMVNVERLTMSGAFDYKLTTNDATVAAGQTLTVDATALDATHTLNFNGAAETDGRFVVTGGTGNDVIATGAGSDIIIAGAGNDTIVSGAGIDTVNGGDGNDTIGFSGNALTASDRVDGGTGTDTVTLSGNYTGANALVLSATTMVNVEALTLGAGHSYAITTNQATVAAGQTLTVNASALDATHTLSFNGAAEINGHFAITGGLGADNLTGSSLSDTFVYASAAQSSSTHFDTINGFHYASDKFDVVGTISKIDTAVSHALSTATFNTDLAAAATSAHLAAHSAMLVTANTGTLKGDVFLVIDQNGAAGYQTGHDLVIELHAAVGTLSTTDFI